MQLQALVYSTPCSSLLCCFRGYWCDCNSQSLHLPKEDERTGAHRTTQRHRGTSSDKLHNEYHTFPLHIVQTQNIIFTSQARQESSPTTGIRFNPKRYEFFLPFALLEATADDRRAGNQYLSLRKSINRVPRGAPRDEQDGFSDGKFEAGTSSSGRDVNAALKGFRSVRSAIIQSPLVTGATGPSMLALISLRLSFHAQSTQNSVKKDQYRLHGPRMIRVSYVISQGLVHSSFSSDIELIHGNKVDNQKGLNPRMRSDTVNLRGRIAERCGASIRTFFRRRSKENIFFRI